jgi:glycosyltransferase involved in cell wall biosynthesis
VKAPRVSFIVPVLNGEADIGRCLNSILGQRCPGTDFEVIVMDNGSTDRTQQIACDFGVTLRVKPGVNIAELRNQGARIAQGELLAFIDADVELMPDWLRNGLAVFKRTDVVIAGCFPRVPAAATWVQQIWDVHQRGGQLDGSRRSVAWLPSMNILVRRDKFIEIDGFNPQLVTAEDVDLCYRLGRHGQILCDPALEAIHWGEAPDLKTFWRKEVWRGTGNLRGFFSHDFRWDEVPSVCFPLYTLCGLLFLVVGCLLDVSRGKFWWSPIIFSLLIVPPLFLGVRTVMRTRLLYSFPQLVLIYFVYGAARAYSVIRRGFYQ